VNLDKLSNHVKSMSRLSHDFSLFDSMFFIIVVHGNTNFKSLCPKFCFNNKYYTYKLIIGMGSSPVENRLESIQFMVRISLKRSNDHKDATCLIYLKIIKYYLIFFQK
jgi:hypothetical protein